METAEITSRNRAYWEAIAAGRTGEPVEFFRAGGCALEDRELAAIGDVTGQRTLHLACSVGDEDLSLARLGAAEVVGVDISPTHLATGRAKAAELGLRVDLREGDLTALDPALTGFDLVLISGGGLCWVPELEPWAATVAERLVPGGRLVISEHHPLWEVLTVRGTGQLAVTSDYLDPHRPGYHDPRKAPRVTWGRTEPLPDHTSFVWSLGRVVTALLGAGLVIRSLEEYAQPELYDGLGPAADALPACYLLVAGRP
ncbi:class I SAM-dependent methyltransferase [Microlunatus sp. GCM10028923]|uniref:class I SAM-dependent methyltransferase n=1 Tax=Microlunatus sp. GCM10028923 TaxID=3273400 RepID=UPI00361D55F9